VATRNEIHVGDFDTDYVIPIYDNDITTVNFDPSGALVRKIFFKQPGIDALIERNAAAEQRVINNATVWCLVYNVTEADVKTAKEFHQSPGGIKMQGLLNFVTGEWRSNIITKDYRGQDLKVYANLE
jgi:hypothetical protein